MPNLHLGVRDTLQRMDKGRIVLDHTGHIHLGKVEDFESWRPFLEPPIGVSWWQQVSRIHLLESLRQTVESGAG